MYNIFTNCDEFASSDSSGRPGGGVSPFQVGCLVVDDVSQWTGGDKTVDRLD